MSDTSAIRSVVQLEHKEGCTPSMQSKDDEPCSYELLNHFPVGNDSVKQLSPRLGIVATLFLRHTSAARHLTGQGAELLVAFALGAKSVT